ncbi:MULTISPECIES: hypothetical protein [unclassified Streptomyces]|uniref:hypothetical protein n=1 Tax=unclassified Streptomyces TaxID=2593676 RepID=UPI002E203669
MPVGLRRVIGQVKKAFGLGRPKFYELVRAGKFPCKVIPAGRTYRVVTADLLRVSESSGRRAPGDHRARPGG